MAPSLSVLIPTQGRHTLRRALDSITEPYPFAVETIIVADIHAPLLDDVAEIARRYDATYVEHDAGHHGYGHPQLAVGYRRASGRSVAVLGDDDVFEPDALAMIIDVMGGMGEPTPAIFRIEMHPSRSRPVPHPFVIWRAPRIECGNVSGQSIVLPNDPSRLAHYPSHGVGDYEFIRDTVANYGGRVAWREELICRCY